MWFRVHWMFSCAILSLPFIEVIGVLFDSRLVWFGARMNANVSTVQAFVMYIWLIGYEFIVWDHAFICGSDCVQHAIHTFQSKLTSLTVFPLKKNQRKLQLIHYSQLSKVYLQYTIMILYIWEVVEAILKLTLIIDGYCCFRSAQSQDV